MGWQVGNVWLVDEQAGLMRCQEVWHARDDERFMRFVEATKQMTFVLGEGLPGEVWQSGAPVWVRDIAADPEFHRASLAGAAGLRTVVTVPLLADGRVRGVAEFFSDEVRDEEAATVGALQELVNRLGEFVLRRQAEAERDEAHRRLELRHALERQAAELNDDVVQNLAVAHYHLARGEVDDATDAVAHALDAAKAIVSELLADVELEPGSLRRTAPARRGGG
jgi:signal transduction protein with GAF and PtsI domain